MQAIFDFIEILFAQVEIQSDLIEYAVFICCCSAFIISFATFCAAVVGVFRSILGALK